MHSQDSDPVRSALLELVACKDLEAKFDGFPAEGLRDYEPRREAYYDYYARIGPAWEAARLALTAGSAGQAAPEPEGDRDAR